MDLRTELDEEDDEKEEKSESQTNKSHCLPTTDSLECDTFDQVKSMKTHANVQNVSLAISINFFFFY